MLRLRRSADHGEQRKQLLILGGALLAVAFVGSLASGGIVAPAILAVLGAFVVGVVMLFPRLTADTYLVVSLLTFAIGRAISIVLVASVFAIGIAGVGGILRLFGMDRLRRDFDKCRSATSMFIDSPHTDAESYERQS